MVARPTPTNPINRIMQKSPLRPVVFLARDRAIAWNVIYFRTLILTLFLPSLWRNTEPLERLFWSHSTLFLCTGVFASKPRVRRLSVLYWLRDLVLASRFRHLLT